MPGAGPDSLAFRSLERHAGLMGMCAMKWTREVSRDRRDCVCQHITAPPRSSALLASALFSPASGAWASGCGGHPHAVSVRSALLGLAALLVLGAPAAMLTSPPTSLLVSEAEALHPARVSSSDGAPAAGWRWPVDGPRVVERPYRAPPSPYGAGHRGVDLAATGYGVEVRAATSGVVHFAGVVVDRPVITVRAGQVLATVEPVTPLVAEGDAVDAGQVIGMLLPGHCPAPCVHLGVRVAGEYVSPLLYLGGLQRAVLLPLGHQPP